MRRKIAVGMLGLALAGCAQSRSSMPGTASRPQPIGMDPVPAIADTINRGTGDPAVVKSTLPDPNNPKWSGEYVPVTGVPGTDATGTAARAGWPGAGNDPSSSPPAALSSPPTSTVLASPSSPPPADATGLLAGAGAQTAALGSQAVQPPPAPTLQPVPEQQPAVADPALARLPDQAPAPTGADATALPDQALPPVEEAQTAIAPGAASRTGRNRPGSGSRSTAHRHRPQAYRPQLHRPQAYRPQSHRRQRQLRSPLPRLSRHPLYRPRRAIRCSGPTPT